MTLVAYNIFFYYIFVQILNVVLNQHPMRALRILFRWMPHYCMVYFCQMNKSNPSLLLNALYTFHCSENKKNFKIPFPPSHFSSPLNQVNSTQ